MLLVGSSATCVPENVIEWPSNVPVAALPLTAVQSANSGVPLCPEVPPGKTPRKATASAAAIAPKGRQLTGI
jgi:hypothetical protein